jgi:hypothetical protein
MTSVVTAIRPTEASITRRRPIRSATTPNNQVQVCRRAGHQVGGVLTQIAVQTSSPGLTYQCGVVER